MANVLHCGQTKTDCAAVRREVSIAHVDVRRFDRNPHFTTFVDVFHYVISIAGYRSQQRSHELNRVMRL